MYLVAAGMRSAHMALPTEGSPYPPAYNRRKRASGAPLRVITFGLALLGLCMAGAWWFKASSNPAANTTPGASPTPTIPQRPTHTPTPMPLPSPTPTPWPWSRVPTRYDIRVNYDFARQTAIVSQQVEYTNVFQDPLDTLVTILDPLRYSGAVLLRSVRINGDNAEWSASKDSVTRLELKLTPSLAPGETLRVTLEYALFLPRLAQQMHPYAATLFGYTQRQANFVDWYALIAPYHPQQGWLAYRPWFHGEYITYPLADYSVRWTLQDPPENLKIATNLEEVPCPEAQNPNERCFQGRQIRQAVFSFSPYYQAKSLTTATKIHLEGFFFPFEAQMGQAVLQTVADALEVYTALWGPYHHKRLVVVQGDSPTSMEADGLIFINQPLFDAYDGDPQSLLVTIAAHETAHQWWFAQVGNDQAQHPWMDEALATYAELLFYERKHPASVPWWWEQRIDAFSPDGYIDGAIYDYSGWLLYRSAVYLNGAYFLHRLRDRLGDDLFFAFLQAYASQRRFDIALPQDFFQVLSQFAPRDAWEQVVAAYMQNPSP